MEGHCSTGQSPQWAVVPMEEEEEEEKEEEDILKQGCAYFQKFNSQLKILGDGKVR